MIILSVIIFVISLLLGFPVIFVIGFSCLVYMIQNGIPLTLLAQRLFTGMDSFLLLAIPFFILMGKLMLKSGATSKLIKWSNCLVGRVRGGLAHVNILTSVIFSGISGSATADTCAIGTIMIPAMEKEGYDRDFSSAVTIASSGISPIIPPSVIMVVYAVVSGVSIGKMFLAGIVPGLLMALGQMIVSMYISKKRKYPIKDSISSIPEFLNSTKEAFLALVAPLIILVGILGGFFTPTEAGVIAATYALLLAIIYKQIKIKDLPEIFWETTLISVSAYLLVGISSLSAWIIASENIPQIIAKYIFSITDNKIIILLCINLFLLFVGMFIEAIAAITIIAPIFLPIVESLGIDPIHFGIILCLNLVIGFVTPPVGVSLFVVSGIANIEIEKVCKAVIPFIIVNVIIVLFITFFPDLVLFIPNLFLGN
jgi:tripartite ATP-independent transporter DctM subunit